MWFANKPDACVHKWEIHLWEPTSGRCYCHLCGSYSTFAEVQKIPHYIVFQDPGDEA